MSERITGKRLGGRYAEDRQFREAGAQPRQCSRPAFIRTPAQGDRRSHPTDLHSNRVSSNQNLGRFWGSASNEALTTDANLTFVFCVAKANMRFLPLPWMYHLAPTALKECDWKHIFVAAHVFARAYV
jgi:hypothetical protein